jgi:hypothetical protein
VKALIAAMTLALSTTGALAATKTYQVTGPVLEVSADSITVQKGKEKWEIARGADAKIEGGDPKVGDKVTIEYRMTAATVTVKPGKTLPATANDNAMKPAGKPADKPAVAK